MSKYPILTIPNPKLRQETQLITKIDENLQELIDDMFQVMYDAEGVGLAATQIGLPLRLAVIDVSRQHNEPRVLINPQIVATRQPLLMREGCLSVPGHVDELTRANWVRMRATDRHGQEFELEAEGLLAECLQHEIDHLFGKLYIDYLSKLKQQLIAKKVLKFLKKNK